MHYYFEKGLIPAVYINYGGEYKIPSYDNVTLIIVNTTDPIINIIGVDSRIGALTIVRDNSTSSENYFTARMVRVLVPNLSASK